MPWSPPRPLGVRILELLLLAVSASGTGSISRCQHVAPGPLPKFPLRASHADALGASRVDALYEDPTELPSADESAGAGPKKRGSAGGVFQLIKRVAQAEAETITGGRGLLRVPMAVLLAGCLRAPKWLSVLGIWVVMPMAATAMPVEIEGRHGSGDKATRLKQAGHYHHRSLRRHSTTYVHAHENGTLTFPDGYPAYELPTGDDTGGVVFGFITIFGAIGGVAFSGIRYCIGYHKGVYGNPKPRKKEKKMTQQELDEGLAESFGAPKSPQKHSQEEDD